MRNEAYDVHCRYSLSHKAAANNVDEHTDMETLQFERRHYHSAIIPYHDYLVFGIWHGIAPRLDYSVAIYHFDTDDHTIEGQLTLIALKEDFDDMGDAVRYGLNYAESCQAQELMRKKV